MKSSVGSRSCLIGLNWMGKCDSARSSWSELGKFTTERRTDEETYCKPNEMYGVTPLNYRPHIRYVAGMMVNV